MLGPDVASYLSDERQNLTSVADAIKIIRQTGALRKLPVVRSGARQAIEFLSLN